MNPKALENNYMKIKEIKSKEVRDAAMRLAHDGYGFSGQLINNLLPMEFIKADLQIVDFENSPQGQKFWDMLYKGVIPNTVELKLPNL